MWEPRRILLAGRTEISRLEELSEAVFAFAIRFALLFTIWFEQYVFFRRYGLEDMVVVLAERRPDLHRALLRLSAEVPLLVPHRAAARLPDGRTGAWGRAAAPVKAARPVRIQK